MNTNLKTTHQISSQPITKSSPLDNQNGSVIVLVLMVLVIMTVIGIASTDSVITENFIIRNVGIHKQNNNLVDSALMEGLQRFMQLDSGNPDDFDPALSVWINDQNITTAGAPEEFINTIWYNANFSRRCLAPNNSWAATTLPLLTTRGENANNNLRYAVVGWGPWNLGTSGGSSSLVVGTGQPVWRQGRILAEYVSVDAGGNDNGFGLVRQEMGVRQQWQ